MNHILITEKDLIEEKRARIDDYRALHILKVLKSQVGDLVKCGILGGPRGTGLILSASEREIVLELSCSAPPPLARDTVLIMALPRPKVLRRVISQVTAIGIKEIYIMASWRVEKSYWQSPYLQEESLKKAIIHGLEQSKDTILPKIYTKQRFKPFVEDELPIVIENALTLLLHPYAKDPCPQGIAEKSALIVGPEGGFIQYELDLLESLGCNKVTIGERPLSVEATIPYVLGKILP